MQRTNMDVQKNSTCRGDETEDSAMTITRLPDEVLLHTFQFLSARDLMTNVALVCHRWYRLAKDEEAWKYIHLNSSSPCLTSLLRFAPAVDSLHMYDRVDEIADLVVGDRKVRVRELLVYNDDRQTTESLFALLRGALGLQALQVIGEMTVELLGLIDGLPLKELHIAPWGATPRFQFQGVGLQRLVLHNPCDELARDLIRGHRGTLRRVLLAQCWDEDTVRALGACTQLQEVRVLCSPALRYLEPLKDLRFLKIELGEAENAESTLRFLASCELLTRIEACRVYCGKPIKGLLRAMAARCHRLKHLILSTYYVGEFPEDHFLELCCFSTLEELTMKNVIIPAALFESILKGTLPKLRKLNLHLCNSGPGGNAIVRLLRQKRPQLTILPPDFDHLEEAVEENKTE